MDNGNGMRGRIIGYSVLLSVFFLVFSFYMGYKTAEAYPVDAEKVIRQLSVSLGYVKNLNTFYIFLFIFLNNAIKALVMIVTGVFFSFIPLLYIFFNGYLIGLVAEVSNLRSGPWETLFSLLPHGILELGGILYSSGLGVWLGIKFFEKLRYKKPLRPAWGYALKKYFMIILPALLVAALIEAYITPLIIKHSF